MVSCQKCGNELPTEKARFCDMCGSAVISLDKASNLSEDESTNTEDNHKSRISNKIIISSILIGGIIIVGIMAGTYFTYIGSQNTNTGSTGSNGLEHVVNEPVIDTIYSDQSEIGAGAISYYTVTVPSNAISATLSGTYQVMDGEIIKVEVLEEEGCPSPLNSFECVSIYSISRDHGSVNLNLEPGKTYYLEFSNKAFLFPTKTVNVDFQLQVTY